MFLLKSYTVLVICVYLHAKWTPKYGERKNLLLFFAQYFLSIICRFQPQNLVDPQNEEVVKEIIETMEVLEQTKKAELPPPHPPGVRKTEIYTDPNVFDELDDKVIQVRVHF